MARKQTRTAATPTTVTVDRMEELLTALNTIDGLPWVEDAWVNKAPANYGVAELTGETAGDYADGAVIAQRFQVRLTIYVTGGSHTWLKAVQDVLDGLHLVYTMPQREYLQDIHKVSWVWDTWIRTPLVRTEVVANG